MRWIEHAIWWQVYPLGLCGAPIREQDVAPQPRLRRLLNWLDYAVDLGASGLLLGPLFASASHGYDTLDYYRIDPRLGGAQEFDDLIAACRSRGLKVLLDGVFSHVSAHHPTLLRVLRQGPDGRDAELFDIDWEAPGGASPRVFEGHEGLARLNHASPRTADLVADVMGHWLDRGIDGWRLDAAYSVDTAFWAQVLPTVRGAHPQAWILGEVIHGDYAGFVEASGADSVTQYELWKAIWSSLRDRNLFELDWALTRHNGFLDSFVPNTFVGNHDVSRIASVLGADGALTAAAILLTLGGVPSVYAGDEQGFLGVKEHRLGGDDAVRPAFPDRPDGLAPWGAALHRGYQDLIGLRRRHPWLVTATTSRLHLSNTAYSYRVGARDGSDCLEIDLQLDASPAVTIRAATGETLWSQG